MWQNVEICVTGRKTEELGGVDEVENPLKEIRTVPGLLCVCKQDFWLLPQALFSL